MKNKATLLTLNMRTRGLPDFYLPSRIAYHIKILLGSAFATVFFSMIWKGTPFTDGFWLMMGLTTLQMEIFMAIAFRIFQTGTLKTGKDYKGKVIVRLLVFYLIVVAIASVFLFSTILVSMFFGGADFSDVLRHFISVEMKPFLISMIVGLGIGSLIFFYFEWTHALKREQKLKEENLIFQYETLKSQVNPHFLFNTLNTLSSLVAKDAELAEHFIAKFSSIYRYILENKDKETVKLSEEIAFVNNYFFLQKIRDDGKVDLQIKVDDATTYRVLPISLQLLVENALKHNIATKESPLKISIFIKDNTMLVVENNLQKKMQIEPSSKIGLKNLGERISLVMKKQVVVEESQDKFVVQLPMIKDNDESADHRR